MCLLLVTAGLCPASANDRAAFSVESMNVQPRGSVYFFNAVFGIRLPTYMINAIEQGFDLPLVMEIEVLRDKRMWFDQKVVHIKQRHRISYHALLDEYSVLNVNAGMRLFFNSLDKALASLSVIIDYPGVDQSSLHNGDVYYARMRFGIDSEQLPLPLKSSSLWRNDWELRSDWKEWKLR